MDNKNLWRKLKMIDYGIQDKVAIVTGAAGAGLGRADCLALAKAGAKIAVLDIQDADETIKQVKALGVASEFYNCDISNRNQVNEVVEKVRQDFGPVSILVNNASILTTVGLFNGITPEKWDRDVQVNLIGTSNITRAVWPDMMEQKWGRVVMMASIAGTMGGLGQTSYAATKASLIGFGKSLALEGARNNITVNIVAPGVMKSQMAMEGLRGDMLQRMEKSTAMKRFGEVEELSDVVAFLCSARSSYMTGQVLQVDGGMGLFVF